MKILFLILDHHSVKHLSIACQETWLQDVDSSSEIVFLGDKSMPDEIQGNEVYKPLKNETRDDITRKMMLGFEHIMNKEWDYVLRVDTDVYCNINTLKQFITYNKHIENLYTGQGIHFLTDGHPNYLSNPGDKLPPEKYKYYYAQGGCYLISRQALDTSIKNMYYPAPIFPWAEDIMVGEAMRLSGVPLMDKPSRFDCGFVCTGWGKGHAPDRLRTLDERIESMRSGYISTHKVSPYEIREIHRALNK